MLSKNSYGSFDEYPKYGAEQCSVCLAFLFVVEIIERLLHRLSKLFLELSWIESEEFLVERANSLLVIHHIQRFSDKVSALEPA